MVKWFANNSLSLPWISLTLFPFTTTYRGELPVGGRAILTDFFSGRSEDFLVNSWSVVGLVNALWLPHWRPSMPAIVNKFAKLTKVLWQK